MHQLHQLLIPMAPQLAAAGASASAGTSGSGSGLVRFRSSVKLVMAPAVKSSKLSLASFNALPVALISGPKAFSAFAAALLLPSASFTAATASLEAFSMLCNFAFNASTAAAQVATLLARSSRAGAASASVSLSLASLFWSSSSTLVTTTLSKVPRDAGSFCRALGSEVSRAVSKSNSLPSFWSSEMPFVMAAFSSAPSLQGTKTALMVFSNLPFLVSSLTLCASPTFCSFSAIFSSSWAFFNSPSVVVNSCLAAAQTAVLSSASFLVSSTAASRAAFSMSALANVSSDSLILASMLTLMEAKIFSAMDATLA
mmetsp:Transcript_22192/g.48753  ORF Transcript_22192/g.48753 Transcript_22192/m.48753 type:complete len:313 (-) Transcript_22192:273-1211(-)